MNITDFDPATPYANATELRRRWYSDGNPREWYDRMVGAYGETETIKLFEMVSYEATAKPDHDRFVIECTEDMLRDVGVVRVPTFGEK